MLKVPVSVLVFDSLVGCQELVEEIRPALRQRLTFEGRQHFWHASHRVRRALPHMLSSTRPRAMPSRSSKTQASCLRTVCGDAACTCSSSTSSRHTWRAGAKPGGKDMLRWQESICLFRRLIALLSRLAEMVRSPPTYGYVFPVESDDEF